MMRTYLFEATNGGNWGKFLVGIMDTEWDHLSKISDLPASLLAQRGWSRRHIWVMDLETGEGALFAHGGLASADLNKHRVWVCPLFEPFLAWLYQQDLGLLDTLVQEVVQLPDAPFEMYGYRRPGPQEAA